MNMILYRPIVYTAEDDCRQIDRLYEKIFHFDYSVKSNVWCQPERTPLGILAIDANSGDAIGHFTSARFQAAIGSSIIPFRMSMGFMTAPEYRGQGIAGNLYLHLRNTIIKAYDSQFIVGFPNDISYHMHINHMEYTPFRDYQFVVLPSGTSKNTYEKYTGNFSENFLDFSSRNNQLEHSAAYMNWRYQSPHYDRWLSASGHIFITVKFQSKIDILFWSEAVSPEELLDFASFLYKTTSVNKVTTWNSFSFLDSYPRENRHYHMCINYLTCSPAESEAIQNEWAFWMGDCELF